MKNNSVSICVVRSTRLEKAFAGQRSINASALLVAQFNFYVSLYKQFSILIIKKIIFSSFYVHVNYDFNYSAETINWYF